MRRSTLLQATTKDSSVDVDSLASQMGMDLKPKSLEEAAHGEIITFEDGTSGIVIDDEEEFNQKYRDEKMELMMKVADQNDPLFDSIAIKTEQKIDTVDLIKRKFGPASNNYMNVTMLKQAFSHFTYGPKGLVPNDDPKAQDYAEKIEAIRSGRVRLPTVSEYEKQLKELEEEKRRAADMDVNNNVQPPVAPANPQPIQPQPVPTPVPEQPVRKAVDPNAPVVGVQPLQMPKKEAPAPVAQQPVTPSTPPVQEVRPQPPVQPQKPAPIQPLNLARMQAEQAGTLPGQQEEEKTPEPVRNPEVVLEVPAEQAATFVETIPPELKEKMDASAVLRVRAVVSKDVPVATRTIDSITQFKNIMPKKVVGSLVKKVLINSGYIVTVEGATSLEMATVAYDPETEYPDWPKRIQFAFDHIVSTSIGDLTFTKFVQETSSMDIDAIIAAIYQASEPDVKKMIVICGNKRCRHTHEIAFSVSNMWDASNFDEDTINYFNEIVAAEDNLFAAREVHSRAPVMKVDYLEIDNMWFGVKHSDAEMASNYFPVAAALANAYNAAVTIYVAFIKEVRFQEDGQTFASTSPEVICQALLNISDDQGQLAIQSYITDNVKEYKSYEFNMTPLNPEKPFVCPKCGRIDHKIRINPDTLVFRKANVAGRL